MSTDTETTLTDDATEADEREEVSNPDTDQDSGETGASDTDDEAVSDEDDQADGDGEEGDEDELEEVEWEGRRARVPPEFKAALMRTADYTRKTQEVAETRKALEARQAELTQQAERLDELQEERTQLTLVERQLKAMDGLDWDKLEEEDPDEARRLFRQRTLLREKQSELKDTVAQKSRDLELDRKRSADEAHAKAVEHCEAVVKREIKGWNDKTAEKVGRFAMGLGFTPKEVIQMTDPRLIKTLHAAMVGAEAQRRLKTTQKLEAADKTDPVKPPGGASPGATRRTTDKSGDAMSTEEWIKAEFERTAARR